MRLAASALLLLAACTMNQPSPTPPPDATMAWDELFARPKPAPDARIAYGEGELQFSEAWIPAGEGPHPTVLMIHGGCWQTAIAERDIMDWIAGDLRDRGIAVWNVEYRGVDRGGGYPGTYEDVLAAAESLMRSADRFALDTSSIVAVGHSAGGHLALWLAARQGASDSEELTSPTPLPIATVISQGGLPDLRSSERRTGHACGTEAPRLMAGGRYDLTSPPEMPAGSARQILVNAERDRIAPPEYAAAYREAMAARGVAVELVTVPGEGHVELVAPGTASWARQAELIEDALGGREDAR